MVLNKNIEDQLIKSLHYEVEEYAILMIDKEGYIQSWNYAAEKIKGYSKEEIIGKNFRIFYTVENIQKGKPDELIKNAIREGKAIDNGWRLRKDGTKFWASIVITAIHDNNKDIVGFIKITRDLTKQKKIEDKFKNIIEHAPDSMLIVDSNGQILIINQQTEKTFGYKRAELLNKEVKILLPKRYYEKNPKFLDKYLLKPYRRGMEGEFNLFGLRNNDEEFPVEISTSPLTKNDEEAQIIVTIRDITEKKLLMDEIVKAKEKAEESNLLKSAFLATMNHELRTPLNHIIGFGNIITELTQNEKIIRFADIIKKSGTNLLAIIEDIISLATMENKSIKLRRESISISEFYVEIKNLSKRILSESSKEEVIKLNFNINDDLLLKTIITDKYKVIQILTNLIENAVKYTDKGFIYISLYQPEETSIVISIQDTGIGIPAKKQKIIFDFFRQGDDSLTSKYGGIGIGLTIANRIANVMGGRITVSSKQGKGSKFTFTLPVNY